MGERDETARRLWGRGLGEELRDDSRIPSHGRLRGVSDELFHGLVHGIGYLL